MALQRSNEPLSRLVTIIWMLCIIITQAILLKAAEEIPRTIAVENDSHIVKKNLNETAAETGTPPPPVGWQQLDEAGLMHAGETRKKQEVDPPQKSVVPHEEAKIPLPGGSDDTIKEVSLNHQNQIVQMDEDEIPDSFKHVFYFFLALSTGAVVFIVVKVYRLRLTRAERKYGVQGDRTTQELTPLPVSIEDGNSDDEDQTLFEINRDQIRIM